MTKIDAVYDASMPRGADAPLAGARPREPEAEARRQDPAPFGQPWVERSVREQAQADDQGYSRKLAPPRDGEHPLRAPVPFIEPGSPVLGCIEALRPKVGKMHSMFQPGSEKAAAQNGTPLAAPGADSEGGSPVGPDAVQAVRPRRDDGSAPTGGEHTAATQGDMQAERKAFNAFV